MTRRAFRRLEPRLRRAASAFAALLRLDLRSLAATVLRRAPAVRARAAHPQLPCGDRSSCRTPRWTSPKPFAWNSSAPGRESIALFRVEYAGPGGFNYSLFLTDVSATDGSERWHTAAHREDTARAEICSSKSTCPTADGLRAAILAALPGAQRPALLRRSRRTLLECHRHRMGRADRRCQRAHHSARRASPGCARRITPAFSVRARRMRTSRSLGSNVDMHTQRPLAFHEGLTVVVGMGQGLRARAARVREGGAISGKQLAALRSAAGVFALMFWLWYSRGRDPRVGAIAVQYEPPAGLSPGEAGTLVDDQARQCATSPPPSSILPCADSLTSKRSEDTHLMGLYSNKEYVFHLNKKPAEWARRQAARIAAC